jgi:uncharacterized membrane protein HdeD (DUF308 family)
VATPVDVTGDRRSHRYGATPSAGTLLGTGGRGRDPSLVVTGHWKEAVMDRTLRTDAADVLAGIGRHWGWVLAFGIVTLLVGLAAVVWPGRTVVVIAVLFGIQLVAAGIYRFVGAFAADEASGGTRVLLALLGVLSFIVGLYALRHILITVAALALLLGIFWIVNGAVEAFTALSHRGMPSRGWTVLMGLLSVIAGVVVLVYPAISLATLAVVLGFWLLVLGVMEVVLAFRLRSLGHATRVATATRPAGDEG